MNQVLFENIRSKRGRVNSHRCSFLASRLRKNQVFGSGPDLGDRSSHPRGYPVCWVNFLQSNRRAPKVCNSWSPTLLSPTKLWERDARCKKAQ